MSAQGSLIMMRKYFDALFSKDLSPVLDALDEHVEWLVVLNGDTYKGTEEVKQAAQNHWAASPDRIKQLVSLFATDEFACLEYVTRGTLTSRADFPSVTFQPTGRSYEFPCCVVFHVTHGKIDRGHEYFDMETVKRQIGAGSAPGTG